MSGAKKYGRIFLDGIIFKNPTLVQLIGMCPTLAISTSVQNAVCMGLAATAVLICSNIAVSALRRWIPERVRIAVFVVLIASFVTTVDLLMKAYAPGLSKALGVYVPLIVVNCIIIGRAEAFAFTNGVLASAIDGLGMGLGFTLAISLLASIREILGAGTWFGIPLFGVGFQPILLMILPAGGFLTLGLVIAFFQHLRGRLADKADSGAKEAKAE